MEIQDTTKNNNNRNSNKIIYKSLDFDTYKSS